MTEENAPPRGKLAAALAKAQAAYLPLKKSKSVTVRMKTGGSYDYQYADLSDMIDATRKALTDNGLSTTQLISDDRIEAKLLHDSGEELSSSMSLPKNLTIQELGSAITYRRRYLLGALLGIASEEDDDGQGAQSGGDKGKSDTRTSDGKSDTQTSPLNPSGAEAPVISAAQVTRLWAIAGEAGWHNDDVHNALKPKGIDSVRKIPVSMYEAFCAHIQKYPVKK